VPSKVQAGFPVLSPSSGASKAGHNSADKVVPVFWVGTGHSCAPLEQEAEAQGLHKEQDGLGIHVRRHRPVGLSRLNQGLHCMTMVPPALLESRRHFWLAASRHVRL
jgi:hypothetical protein